jgi:hypothetical protein
MDFADVVKGLVKGLGKVAPAFWPMGATGRRLIQRGADFLGRQRLLPATDPGDEFVAIALANSRQLMSATSGRR